MPRQIIAAGNRSTASWSDSTDVVQAAADLRSVVVDEAHD